MDRRAHQALNLQHLFRTGAFQFVDERTPWFPYTSGQIGPYYVQSTTVEKDGEAYAAAIASLTELIRAECPPCDALSGGETRDWDFSNPAAVALRKPHVKLYKDGKVLGADPAGKTILHVADLNNEGSSVRDYWKPTLERHGGRLIGVVSFVDRLEDGYTLLRELDLQPRCVVPLDERAWDLALREGAVTREVHAVLVARARDRHAWARHTLLAHPAFFRSFYRDPKTQPKALKILRAYPDLQAELSRIAGA